MEQGFEAQFRIISGALKNDPVLKISDMPEPQFFKPFRVLGFRV